MFVNQVTHISNLLFKHTIGGRVCDHDGCQILFVLVHLVAGREKEKRSLGLLKLLKSRFLQKSVVKVIECFTGKKQVYQQVV